VIEVVDTEENVNRIMPQVDEMVPEGLITMEKVRVLRYAPDDKRAKGDTAGG
jgi:PII-like signaling protein